MTPLKRSFPCWVMQPTVVSMTVCQTIAVRIKSINHLPTTLRFCMNGFADTLCQISRMFPLSIHMCRILWLKFWSAELPTNKCLDRLPFICEDLFGPCLNYYIKEITGGKSTLLSQKKGPCTLTSRFSTPEVRKC